MFSTVLRNEITKALGTLGFDGIEFAVEHPTILEHGDFATNVALVAAKRAAKNPRALAEEILAVLQNQHITAVSRMEIAGPGFINFYLEDGLFHDEIALVGDAYGADNTWTGKKILVEHSSPNLFKPFHIGHLMNNTVGESIVRLAKFSGGSVTAISYPSDVSLGIAKAVAVVLRDGIEKLRSFVSEREKLAYLGECYAEGTRLYDQDEIFKDKVRAVSEALFEEVKGEILDIYNECKAVNLEYFVAITTRLGSHFDAYIYESETGRVGEQIVRAHTGTLYKESDGAVIYEGEQDGLHTRVFINKEGRPTYEAKDTGLLSLKFDRYNPDLCN
jgi:arginyl-tRNA synthetase